MYLCAMQKILTYKIYLKIICLTMVLGLWCPTATAQEEKKAKFVFGIDNFSFFDNREVSSPYQRSQTIFGSRLGGEVGLQFGANQILIGAMGIKDFGEKDWVKEAFTFYYHYEKGPFSGAFGLFPRQRLKAELPDIFIYDSLRYYSPTINGALIQYTAQNGYAEAYCNWLSKQGNNKREIFEVVSNGRFGHKGFYGGWNFQMLHYALPSNATNEHIYDKIMLNPHIGYETDKMNWLDALTVNVGAMMSFNRDRTDMKWKRPLGFMGEVKLKKWRFELHDLLYAGERQFSDYEKHGVDLHRGDPYFQSRVYNRTDLSFYLLNKHYIQCRATASVHFTEGEVDNSQQIILRIALDKDFLSDLFKR